MSFLSLTSTSHPPPHDTVKAKGDAKLAEMYPALAATEEEMMPATPGVQRVDSRSGVVYNDLDSSPMGSARSRPDESDLTAHVLRTLQGVGGGDEGSDTAAQIGRLRALVASAIALRRVAGTLVSVGVPSMAHASHRGACKHSKNWCLLLPFWCLQNTQLEQESEVALQSQRRHSADLELPDLPDAAVLGVRRK